MTWITYALSRKQRKNADRVGGLLLWLPWPEGLAPGAPLRLAEVRDATAPEHAAAMRIVGDSCRELELVPVRSLVGRFERGKIVTNGEPWQSGDIGPALFLGPIIIGRRWVAARGAKDPMVAWAPLARVERAA